MIDKSLTKNDRPSDACISAHGSSLYRAGDSLDEERAASMADEGGASGALTDALEQAGSSIQERLPARRSRVPGWVRVAAAAAAALGVVSVFLIWTRRR